MKAKRRRRVVFLLFVVVSVTACGGERSGPKLRTEGDSDQTKKYAGDSDNSYKPTPSDEGCSAWFCPKSDGANFGDPNDTAGDSYVAGDDASQGDHAAEGDSPGGDLPGGDDFQPGDTAQVAVHVWLQADANATPAVLPPVSSHCVTAAATFYLEGPVHDPWQVEAVDRLGISLRSIPKSGPGELAPDQQGGGSGGLIGYATVAGSELALTASEITVKLSGQQRTVTNSCPAPLLTAWVFEAGVGGDGVALEGGVEVCPQPAPWVLAIEAPPEAIYDVAALDFETGDVSSFNEQSLPQNEEGLVMLFDLPARGRIELELLDVEGNEVEDVATYIQCP